MTEKQKVICHKIFSHYGIEKQLRQLIEECAELIQACSKSLRAGDEFKANQNGETLQKLYDASDLIEEEIADVEIMLEQIKDYYLFSDSVEDKIEYKLGRQLQRIEKESADND